MATRAEIMEALRAADAAGDHEGAARLAAMYDAAPSDTPEGEVGWLTPVDDAFRVAADTMSRGYLDKLLGEEAQAHTARSRERLSDWVETPTEIASAVVSSPYRVGSTAAGGLFGALEGAATAYGNQKDWTPDVSNIAYEAGKGALLGSGAAKAGEIIGKGFSKIAPEAPVQGPSLPPSDPKLSRVGTAVHAVAKQPLSTTVPIDVGLNAVGLPPVVSGTARAARVARPFFKPQSQPGAAPIQPEPEAAAALRDLFAKMSAGYGRSP